MRATKIYFSILVIAFFAGCLSMGGGINITNPDFLKDAGVNKEFNPHNDKDCHVCHLASKEVLMSDKLPEKEQLNKRRMQTDLYNLCDSCHSTKEWRHHPAGITTTFNVNELPLDEDGKINCAITCHDVHTKDPHSKKGRLRFPFDDLCVSCHIKH